MNGLTTVLVAGNGLALIVALACFECCTKTLVYWRARWFYSGEKSRNKSDSPSPNRLRELYGREGASFFQDSTSGRWLFQVEGYSATDLAQLPSRLRETLPLTESIALLGAQPCYFMAEAAKSGQPGDWLAELQKYVLALDAAMWRKTLRSFVAFHDHTAVVRLISLRHASNIFCRELREPANRHLGKIIAALQARDLALLLDDRLFDYQTNHGPIKCLGLLHFALDAAESERRLILRQVTRWMATREDFFISDDGVPLEISPTYWELIYLLLREIKELLNLLGVPTEFPKLALVEQFFRDYSIDGRVNRFGNSANGHDLHLGWNRLGQRAQREELDLRDWLKKPADGVICRVYDTGLFVADFAAGGAIRAQLVLNAQDVRPWIHGQQSQMAMGYFADEVFWVDSPGRYASGKTGIKARIDDYRNQSVPTREGCGYVAGWRFARADKTPAGAVFSFVLSRAGQTLLQRTLTIKREGGFTLSDSAPGGVVETRFLLPPETQPTLAADTLTMAADGRRAVFNYSGAPEFEEGLISFQRNLALPTKIFRLRGSTVEFGVAGVPVPADGLQVRVSTGYPYRKRDVLADSHPNSIMQQVSVKKLKAAMVFVLVVDAVVILLMH
jgi:hypothetical protein